MLEQKKSLYEEQKKIRPKIEDVVGDFLDGDTLNIALDFIAYLRKNKMPPQWGSANSWTVSYKNKRVCYIRVTGTNAYHNLEVGSWHISFNGDYNSGYENFISSENLKELAWANVQYCTDCNTCKPGKNVTVLGKEFYNVCKHAFFVMRNPKYEEIECAKRLLQMRKNAISNLK